MGHRARAMRRPSDSLQHLIVPRRLVVGMQEHVRVPLDQPGQQRRAGKIGHRRAGRRIADAGPGRLDPVAPDTNGPAFVHGLAVENAGGFQHHGRRWRCGAAQPAAPA